MTTNYIEDWQVTNPYNLNTSDNDHEVRIEFLENSGLDAELFDSEQLIYLKDFLSDYRMEIARTLVEFICKPDFKGKSLKNKNALFVKIAGRAALLDELLNNRKLKINEWKSIYGVSLHQRYDVLYEVIDELKDSNLFTANIFKKR